MHGYKHHMPILHNHIGNQENVSNFFCTEVNPFLRHIAPDRIIEKEQEDS